MAQGILNHINMLNSNGAKIVGATTSKALWPSGGNTLAALNCDDYDYLIIKTIDTHSKDIGIFAEEFIVMKGDEDTSIPTVYYRNDTNTPFTVASAKIEYSNTSIRFRLTENHPNTSYNYELPII
jgi:hypothetical protein